MHNKILNIMHVVWSLDVGGAETLTYDIARHLPRTKFNPSVCCIDQGGLLVERYQEKGIPVFYREKRHGLDIKLIFWLRKLIIDHRIDIVHAHQYSPMFYSALATLGVPSVKLVYTEHGRCYPDSKNWKRRLINPLLVKQVDHLISISESTRLAMAEIDNMEREAIQVILNGVFFDKEEYEFDKAAKKAALGIPEDVFVVGTACRLENVKNLPMMVRALKIALEKASDICLVIAGKGSLEEELKSFCRDLKIDDKVNFIGMRNDLAEIYPLMDAFLMTSFTEGISLTLLEAMNFQLPVIATNTGGTPEVVDDGNSGYLVELNDDDKMANLILKLKNKPGFRKSLGACGKAIAINKFSFDGMMSQYLQVYKK